MKQREQAEDLFLIGKLENVVDPVELGDDVAVGERDAFRSSGSTARVDEKCSVVPGGFWDLLRVTLGERSRGPIAKVSTARVSAWCGARCGVNIRGCRVLTTR